MPDQIKMLKQILDYVEAYKKEVGNDDIKEFAIFLKDRLFTNQQVAAKQNLDGTDFENYKSYPEVEFSTLLTGLYRFAKHYIKKAFSATNIKTIDEFGFLATLLTEKNLLKNELISKHLLEFSSGSEMIKRLIKNGLVHEYPDAHDKRAKRVSLTEKGEKEIMKAFHDMHKVSELIIGNLDENELKDALSSLNKLTYFHLHIHEKDRNTSLNDLHTRYVLEKG